LALLLLPPALLWARTRFEAAPSPAGANAGDA
jgi:hypothetical protein